MLSFHLLLFSDLSQAILIIFNTRRDWLVMGVDKLRISSITWTNTVGRYEAVWTRGQPDPRHMRNSGDLSEREKSSAYHIRLGGIYDAHVLRTEYNCGPICWLSGLLHASPREKPLWESQAPTFRHVLPGALVTALREADIVV